MAFRSKHAQNVTLLRDLRPGMRLHGGVVGVTDFAAFLDVHVVRQGPGGKVRRMAKDDGLVSFSTLGFRMRVLPTHPLTHTRPNAQRRHSTSGATPCSTRPTCPRACSSSGMDSPSPWRRTRTSFAGASTCPCTSRTSSPTRGDSQSLWTPALTRPR